MNYEQLNDLLSLVRGGFIERATNMIEQELAKPKEPKISPVGIGVDVTPEGTHVIAVYRRSNAVEEMFYSQFHPLTKRQWVGLTEKESFQIAIDAGAMDAEWLDFIKLVEQKIKEKKNNG